jgi:hypothetical protein
MKNLRFSKISLETIFFKKTALWRVLCDPLLSPFPTLLVGRVVLPIHSLVDQRGPEFFAQAIINVMTWFPMRYAESG